MSEYKRKIITYYPNGKRMLCLCEKESVFNDKIKEIFAGKLEADSFDKIQTHKVNQIKSELQDCKNLLEKYQELEKEPSFKRNKFIGIHRDALCEEEIALEAESIFLKRNNILLEKAKAGDIESMIYLLENIEVYNENQKINIDEI